MIARAPFHPSNTVALVCGPEIMMRFAVMELQKRGVQAERTYLSMERNMKCALGYCGHCQYGPTFVCKDGPVFRLDNIASIFGKGEI
jgi:NAD(P)H-flavin reductase